MEKELRVLLGEECRNGMLLHNNDVNEDVQF